MTTVSGKTCTWCSVAKALDAFAPTKNGKFGRASYCRECEKQLRRERVERLKQQHIHITHKICTGCSQDKPSAEFSPHNCSRDGLHTKCRACHTSYSGGYERKHRRLAVEWIAEHGAKCEHCGETDIRVLEQVHVDPSLKTLEFNRPGNREKLEKELENAQILCAFCRRQKVYRDRHEDSLDQDLQQTSKAIAGRRTYKRNSEYARKRKRDTGGCAICGRSCDTEDAAVLCAFDWDHIDPSTKHRDVANIVGGCSIDKIETEISKCRLLCVNCHIIHTRQQRGQTLRTVEHESSTDASKENVMDWTQLFVPPELL